MVAGDLLRHCCHRVIPNDFLAGLGRKDMFGLTMELGWKRYAPVKTPFERGSSAGKTYAGSRDQRFHPGSDCGRHVAYGEKLGGAKKRKGD